MNASARNRRIAHTGQISQFAPIVLILLGGVLLFISPSLAQNDRLAAIAEKRGQIERIIDAVERSPEQRRDGMRFRADQLAGELAAMIQSFPIESLDSGQVSTDLLTQVEWFQNFVIERFAQLQARIREEVARFDEFAVSTEASISRAFQQDLRSVSASYVDIMVNLLALNEKLGQVDQELRDEIRESVALSAEGLAGQILLDGMTLDELRNMIRLDPTNTELAQAERAVERKQRRSLDSLDKLLPLMEGLELSTGSHRALLLAERGSIGVELLNREVFMTLLGNQFKQARQQVLTRGPNILFKTSIFAGIVLIGWLLARLIQRAIRQLLQRESVELHKLMEGMLISLSFGIVFTVGLVIALSTIGISLVPMVAGLGVAGIVIGFALQDTLSNFASGWMILIYRPYDVDDHVIAGGVEGVVKRMNLVSTTIATFDNQRLVIPNSKIWGDVITNLTANRIRRLSIPVSVSFGEDLDRVEQVLREEINAHEGILKKPEPNVFVDTLGSSEIIMMTHAWVKTQEYWAQLRSLTKKLKQRLDDEDMEIPYPQQDVYIRSFPGVTGTGQERSLPAPAAGNKQ